MDRPVAQVIAVNNGRAIVLVTASPPCSRCAAGKGCGAGLIYGSQHERRLEVAVESDIVAGDHVALSFPAIDLLRAAICAYGLPLAGMLTVLVLARMTLGNLQDGVAIIVASAGLVVGWLAGRWQLRNLQCLRRFVAEVVPARR